MLFEKASAAGYPGEAFESGCLGAAGAGREAERLRVEHILRSVLGQAPALTVVSDNEIALTGGLRSESGFLLLSGTGSIAYARTEDGKSFRAGGLGHWLSDEGSGFSVGFNALARTLRSIENRDVETSMLPALLEFFNLASEAELVPFVYKHFDKANIARSASLIADFRDQGDPLALDIYENAAQELVSLSRSVYERAAKVIEDHRLLLWGSMLEKDAWLKGRVAAILKAERIDLEPSLPLGSAMEGACLIAMRNG